MDEVDRHILRKYELDNKLGKGACACTPRGLEERATRAANVPQDASQRNLRSRSSPACHSDPSHRLTVLAASVLLNTRNPGAEFARTDGIVWKAVDKKSKETVALKKIFDAFQNATDAQRTYREVHFLLKMRGHPNIITLQHVLKAE